MIRRHDREKQENLRIAREALSYCRRGQVRGRASVIRNLVKQRLITYEEIGTSEEEIKKLLHQADIQAALNAVQYCQEGNVEMYAPILFNLIREQKKVTLAEARLSEKMLKQFLHQANVRTAQKAVTFCRKAGRRQFKEARMSLDRLLILIRNKGITYWEAGTNEKEILEFINLYMGSL